MRLILLLLMTSACSPESSDQVETVARLTQNDAGQLLAGAGYCGVGDELQPGYGCAQAQPPPNHARGSASPGAPRAKYESPAVLVPPDSTLAVGLATGTAQPAAFVITARGPRGESVVLEETLHSHGKWVERRIDLDSWAGQEVSFGFSNAGESKGGSLPARALWGAPRLQHPGSAPARPNLVLILLHTAGRAAPGARPVEAPGWYRRMEADGTTFSNAMNPSDDPVAALGSLMTGEYPIVHGLPETKSPLPLRLWTLAETLAREGYATGASADAFPPGAKSGLARGFDSYRYAAEGDATTRSNAALGNAETWIRSHGEDLFFLFVGLSSPKSGSRRSGHTTHEVDRILGTLEEVGVLDETLVVVIAPGAQGSDPAIEPPGSSSMLLRLPDAVPAGRAVPDLVSLVDVMPTLLRLLNVPERPGTSGRSLADAMHGDPLVGHPVRFAEGRDATGRWIAARTETDTWFWQMNRPGLQRRVRSEIRNRESSDAREREHAIALLEAYRSLERHRRPPTSPDKLPANSRPERPADRGPAPSS